MNRTGRAFLTGLLLLAVAATGFAQGYPVPAKTPETTVSCATCGPNGGPGLTVGYKAPIQTFTGRFVDSNVTTEWFQPVRTIRANFVMVKPDLNRIYFRFGDGAVAAYQLSTFFTRLESGEQLIFAIQPVPSNRQPTPEVWLNWNDWFNPELSSWKIVQADGAVRMPSFDVDDQGYVYVASTIYGWGVVKDSLANGGVMKSMFQKFPNSKTDATPTRIAAIKAGDHYYAYLGGISSSATPLWDVTNRSNPIALNVNVPSLPKPFARNAAGDRIAMLDNQGALVIYSVANFVQGGAPLFTSPNSGYMFLASDGTNFFGLRPGSPDYLDAVVPYGGTYTLAATNTMAAMGSPNNFRVGDGYAVITGTDGSNGSGNYDMQVFKLDSSFKPTLLPTNASPADPTHPSYFRNYYTAPPAGYGHPGYINIVDGLTYKASNGNLYLIFCGRGIGDVYQLAGGDTIAATNDGPQGTLNPNTPAASAGKTFYGDPIGFTGKTQSTNVSSISWNFGNPEGGTANTSQLTSPNQSTIPYQYSNLTPAGLGTKTATATSVTDSQVKGTASVSLQLPAARFALSGLASKYLFAAPNASSPAPIVVGDGFVDASDGTVESHYVSWTQDGNAIKGTPINWIDVGQCGPHSLVYQTFYGPYTGSGTTLTTTHPANAVVTNPPDFIVGLDPANPANSTFNYTVRPFAAVITLQSTDPTYVYFSGADSRGLTSSAVTAAQGFTWKWEVVNASGQVYFGPQTGSGPTIAQFAVPKTTFTGQANLQARLTLKTNAALLGSCAGLETTSALSAPMNPPNPVVAQSGNCQTQPCTFSVSSSTGIDIVADHWTFQWLVNGAAPDGVNVTAAGGTTSSTFTPTFLKPGTYNISVNVTNAIGSTPAQNPSNPINITAPACAKLDSQSFLAVFSGANSGCTSAAANPPCSSGETVTFTAQLNTYSKNPYNPSCSVTTYKWTFPDGTTQTTTDPTVSVDKSVSTSGTVRLTVSNSTGDSFDYTVGITVGVVTPPPPPPNSCGGMTAANVFPAVYGTGCGNNNTGCAPGTALTFKVETYLYDPSCLSNSTGWNFGDGGSGSNVTTTHVYATANHTYSGMVTIRNTAGETVTKTFAVTTGATGGGLTCGTMTDGAIHVSYSGGSCTTGTTCAPSDTLAFVVNGYDSGCIAAYNWNFGDNSSSSQATPQHAYSNAGTYSGSVTLTNTPGQTFTKNFSVKVGTTGGVGCAPVTPNLTLSIAYTDSNGTCSQAGGACGVGQPINFSILTYQYDIGCASHTYDWDFGDGTPHSSSATPTHQYAAAGTYTAHCVVNNGASYTLTQAVTVGGLGGGITVQPSIGVDAMQGVANGFIFYAHFDHPEAVAKWQWNFGDGRSNAIQTVTGNAADPDPVAYIYADGNKYTITLTAYASNGQQIGTDNVPNEVTAPPKRRSVKH